jgi:dCMP deaminase
MASGAKTKTADQACPVQPPQKIRPKIQMEETMSIETSTRWAAHWMSVAALAASMSKDSTKVGCVAVKDRRQVATGFNGMPQGVVDTPDRYENRETKLEMITHAEANCIATAARHGVSLAGCTLYVTHPPCPHCFGLIIQAGIGKVFYPPADRDFLTRWAEQIKITREMCIESGVLMMEIVQ